MELVKLLCAKEVAEILGVDARTAARLMRTGEITAFKMSGAIWRTTGRYVGEYILRMLEERERAALPYKLAGDRSREAA